MASPLLPQQPYYVPLGRVDDFADPLAGRGQAYRTNEPWRAATRSTDDAGTYKAKARDISRLQEDDESANLSSDERTTGSEDDEHCPLAARILLSEKFKIAVAAAILASAVLIALEIDYGTTSGEEYEGLQKVWDFMNSLFLIFFTFEIILRLLTYRCSFFYNNDFGWNIFDFSIVLFSWVDEVVSRVKQEESAFSQYMTLLRMVRILRILRVLRLFKQARQLLMLANGLYESIQLVIWIMLLMFMGMLIFAIFLTDFVGNQAYKFNEPEEIQKYWYGVIPAFNTLFQFLTFDNWSEITREVTDGAPWMRIPFTAYIFIAAFAMLSLLTGVIAEHMTEVSANATEEKKAAEEEDLQKFFESMEETFFHQPSSKGTNHISREDLFELMKNEELRKYLDSFNIVVDGHEVNELFELLDYDNDGWISWDEFKNGILRLRDGTPNAKDMLRMRNAIDRVAKNLQGGVGEAITMHKLEEVNEVMNGVDERLGLLERQLRGFMEYARENVRRSPSTFERLFQSQD